jgi:hypothetical protein
LSLANLRRQLMCVHSPSDASSACFFFMYYRTMVSIIM